MYKYIYIYIYYNIWEINIIYFCIDYNIFDKDRYMIVSKTTVDLEFL